MTKTFVGLDAGHNNLKMILQDGGGEKIHKALMPSFILNDPDLFKGADPSTPGLVHYLSGDRGDLIGKSWLMGGSAISANEKATQALASIDTGTGKIDFALHSLLSLLSSLPKREEWDISLVSSNHRADVYANLLKEKQEGQHRVLLSGSESLINIKVCSVVNEATHYRPKPGKETVLLDFGGGTTILVKYSSEGKNISREVIDIGVDRLIDDLYENKDIYALLHKDRSRYEIRLAIEEWGKKKEFAGDIPKIIYGIEGKGGKDISAPYWSCITLWTKAYILPLLRLARESLRKGATLELIGGGALLPGIDKVVASIINGRDEKHSINKVSSSALWLNAMTLLQIAKNSEINLEGEKKNV